MKQETYKVVCWPEIQFLFGKEGFEQNAYLINALRPAAEPAYLVANPHTGMYGTYGYNAMCGGPITNGFIG